MVDIITSPENQTENQRALISLISLIWSQIEGPGTPGTGMVPSVKKKDMIAHMVNLMTGRVTHKSDTLKMFQWNHFDWIQSYQDPKKTAGLLQSRDALWLLQSLWWPRMVSEGQALFRASWLIGTAVMACTICTMNRWRAPREVQSKQDGGFQSWSVVEPALPLWKMMEWVTVGIIDIPNI